MASSIRSGTQLRCQAWEIVYNVANYLRNQKELHNLKYNIVKATHNATGVSESSIKAIMAKGKNALARGQLKFATPSGEKKKHKKELNRMILQCV